MSQNLSLLLVQAVFGNPLPITKWRCVAPCASHWS